MSTYSLNDIGRGVSFATGCSQNVVSVDASDVVNLSGELTIGNTSISSNSLLTINGTSSTSRIFTSINSTSSTSSTEQLVISHNGDKVEINNANTSTFSEIDFLARVNFTSPDTKCVTPGLNNKTTRLANTEFVQNELDNLQIGDLSDVTITSATTGHFLHHNGSAWINATLDTSKVTENTNYLYYTDSRVDNKIGNTSINALSDVNITSTGDGKVLKYNGSNWTQSDTIYEVSQNVGIGKSVPTAKLHIYETNGTSASATNGTIFIDKGDSQSSQSIVFKSNMSSDDYGAIEYLDGYSNAETAILRLTVQNNTGTGGSRDQIRFNNGGTDMMTIGGSGIGIGADNPSYPLHIYESGSGTSASGTNGTIVLQHQNTGGTNSITFRSAINSGSDYGAIEYDDGNGTNELGILRLIVENDSDGNYEDQLRVKIAGSDRVRFASNGVSINTSSDPSYTLDVGGKGRFSNFIVGGFIFSAWSGIGTTNNHNGTNYALLQSHAAYGETILNSGSAITFKIANGPNPDGHMKITSGGISLNNNLLINGTAGTLYQILRSNGPGSGSLHVPSWATIKQGTGVTISNNATDTTFSINQAASLNLTDLRSTTRVTTDASTNVATTAFVQTAISNLITNNLSTKLNSSDFTNTANTWLNTKGIDDLSDVNTTGASGGKILKYSSTTNKWEVADDGGAYTGISGVTVDNSTNKISIGQSVGTTNNVTFNSINANISKSTNLSISSTTQVNINASSYVSITSGGNFDFFSNNGSMGMFVYNGNWDVWANNINFRNGSGTILANKNSFTNWDTAFGWGNHANAGYLNSSNFTNTANTWLNTKGIDDLSDVNTTGASGGKILKYSSTTNKWEVADDGGAYTGISGVTVDNSTNQISIGQPVATTNDVTFNSITTTSTIKSAITGSKWKMDLDNNGRLGLHNTGVDHSSPNSNNIYLDGTNGIIISSKLELTNTGPSDTLRIGNSSQGGGINIGGVEIKNSGQHEIKIETKLATPSGSSSQYRGKIEANHYTSALYVLNSSGGSVTHIQCYNNGTIYHKGNFYNTSDDRIKSYEEDILSATATLSKLNPKHYKKHPTLILDEANETPDLTGVDWHYEYGFIAQELEDDETLSHFINSHPETGLQHLNYIELIPILVQSLKETWARVSVLEQTLA